jgi:hypothetical protein
VDKTTKGNITVQIQKEEGFDKEKYTIKIGDGKIEN